MTFLASASVSQRLEVSSIPFGSLKENPMTAMGSMMAMSGSKLDIEDVETILNVPIKLTRRSGFVYT